MKIHAISTGAVKITHNWIEGKGQGIRRLLNTVFDTEYSDWLPIWCFVIEHPQGLIVVDTGIMSNANDAIYFPPYMPLIQRAAKFSITPEQEIGYQMRERGLNPDDVRYVILTHLHQDHDGGLAHFPNAEFIVSRKEWDAAQGLSGRMAGYLNQHWPAFFKPELVDFADGRFESFPQSQQLLEGITLVLTRGHSAGHMSVIVQDEGRNIVIAGDVAYTEQALHQGIIDGVSVDVGASQESMQYMRDFVQAHQAAFLPAHDPDSAKRLDLILA